MIGGTIHHIDLTVGDLTRSTTFYDRVMPLLGFSRSLDVPEGPIWVGAALEIGLVQARSPATHDRFAAGLHHLAFGAPSRACVSSTSTPRAGRRYGNYFLAASVSKSFRYWP